MRFVAVALLTLLLAACSEPRIDATSDATLNASIANVRESLAADKRSQFDALIAETRAGDAAENPAATGEASSGSLASINNMPGMQAIDALRKLSEQRAEQRTRDQERLRAEQAAREAKALAALSAKAEANAASLAKLRNIEVTDLRPQIRTAGMRRSYGITAKIHNTLDVPLASIGFDYSLRNPGGAEAAGSGSGAFVIKDALQPGETRTLEATVSDASDPLATAVKAMEQDRKTVLAVTITGATRADGKSVVVPALTAAEEKRLKRLRAGTSASVKR
jgi:hypothetical protein